VADRSLSVAFEETAPIPLDVSFACAAGDVLAIFGPSGSGKTTILRSIAGLYRPSRAFVRSGTETWTDTATRVFVPPHRRRVGFVFQDYALFPHLSASGNVMTALVDRPRAERRARAAAVLAEMHLTDRSTRMPDSLSGGEKQRVALARALAREPALLLLDEPFAAVDRSLRRRLQDEIDTVRRSLNVPSILVTHDFEDVVRLATHVLLLGGGRKIAEGPLTTLMSRPDLSWLRSAVGLGSVYDATVGTVDAERGLAELWFHGSRVLVSNRSVSSGANVRIRIPAREVILATEYPTGLSVHNSLRGVVTAVHVDPAFEHPVVQLAIGSAFLLAEVTSDAVTRLGIAPGVQLFALVKSVSVQLVG
jgi:molybdate transport system ATP-binding protein